MRQVQLQLLATKSANTLRAYRSDLSDFDRFCEARGFVALPATALTVASYVVDLAGRGLKPSTILRRRASISWAHRLGGHRLSGTNDRLLASLLGTFRKQLEFSTSKVELDVPDLGRLLAATAPRGAAGSRDRAMLLLGFAGGFRPSELVALTVEDIHVRGDWLWIRIQPSTSGPLRFGRSIQISRGEHLETCPVRALRSWYEVSGIASGAVFRSVDRHGRIGDASLTQRAVSLVIKRAAVRAGLDPALYAGHSLRAGLVAAAAAGGAPERVIMEHTGLRSLSTVRRYARRGSRVDKQAPHYLGL